MTTVGALAACPPRPTLGSMLRIQDYGSLSAETLRTLTFGAPDYLRKLGDTGTPVGGPTPAGPSRRDPARPPALAAVSAHRTP